jgi:malonyl-CoA decarboxylase
MSSPIGSGTFLADLFQAIAERGRSLVYRSRNEGRIRAVETVELFETLLSGRGEASGLALAQEALTRWETAGSEDRLNILTALLDRFGPDQARLDAAIDAYKRDKTAATAATLHDAAEPRRQELIRRLNMVPGAMEVLVAMRAEILGRMKSHPELGPVDEDFVHLLSSWFNRGFLVLRRIDWSTSANVLEKIIEYEAVHAIDGWDDLRRRLIPPDRRCFAFFHPRLADEPLIFVEVALMRQIPSTIDSVLAEDRERVLPEEATTAVFYSISNTQAGLRGISFGNFLLKQVIEDLRDELPGIEDYVTLSPAPRLAAWLGEAKAVNIELPGLDEALRLLSDPEWPDNAQAVERLRVILPLLAARYFAFGRTDAGLPIDPVARFHLGNGARLERINFLGDRSPKALADGYGIMVNYLYRLDELEKNHERFVSKGEVVMSRAVKRLLGDIMPRETAA